MNCDVLIVGGGPAGATLAAFLAKLDLDVLVLEGNAFPRYHIGESLIPQVLDVLEDSGALPAVEKAGFLRKEGGIFRWGSSPEPWSFYFDETPEHYQHTYAYQVVRSSFDKILLDHSRDCGAQILNGFTAIDFNHNGDLQPSSSESIVSARNKAGKSIEIHAKMVADCSGGSGWLARKFNLRKFDPVLKNIAFYGYFKNVHRAQGRDANAIFCEAVPSGWYWNIPLHDGTNSVGLITKAPVKGMEAERMQLYRSGIESSTYLKEMLKDAEMISELRSAPDYSYYAKALYGSGFIIVGDAGNFVDPVWSTGVFFATTAAQKSATAIQQWLANDDETAFASYQTDMQKIISSYREFIHFFYANHTDPDSYFWKAHQLVPNAIDPHDAFIRLVSGRMGV